MLCFLDPTDSLIIQEIEVKVKKKSTIQYLGQLVMAQNSIIGTFDSILHEPDNTLKPPKHLKHLIVDKREKNNQQEKDY